MRPVIIGARRWLVVATASLALATWLGFVTHGCITAPPGPAAPPKACRDQADLRNREDSYVDCDPPSRVEVQLLRSDGDGLALFKCVCPSAAPDAGGGR